MPTLHDLSRALPPGSGPVGLLSSDEFLPPVADWSRALIEAAGPQIGLVLCADHRAAPQSAGYARRHFEPMGAEIVTEDVLHEHFEATGDLPDVDIVFLAGGSPPDLLDHMQTPGFWDAVCARWLAGDLALAGSSAGTMVMGSHCLKPNPGDFVPTVWAEGLGPLKEVAFAVHATSRARSWLEGIAATAPVPLMALGDQTGLLLRAGDEPRILGSQGVWFV